MAQKRICDEAVRALGTLGAVDPHRLKTNLADKKRTPELTGTAHRASRVDPAFAAIEQSSEDYYVRS